MKQIYLLAAACGCAFSAFSQINYGFGEQVYGSCNFEAACPEMVIDSATAYPWQIGHTGKTFFAALPASGNAIMTDTVQPYPAGKDVYFEIAVQNVFYFNTIVSFRHKYQTTAGMDGGYIEVSYDNDDSWVNVVDDPNAHFMYEFNNENLYAATDTILGGIPAFSGSSDWLITRIQWVWEYPIRSVPPQVVHLRFHFKSDTIVENLDGWIIDDLVYSYGFMSGLEENDLEQLTVFPSPVKADGTLVIPGNEQAVRRAALMDLQGNLLFETEVQHNELNLGAYPTLATGIYLLRITEADGKVGLARVEIQ